MREYGGLIVAAWRLFDVILVFFPSGGLCIVFSLPIVSPLLTAQQFMTLQSRSCALTVLHVAAGEICLMILGQSLTRSWKDIPVSLWEAVKEKKTQIPTNVKHTHIAFTEQERGGNEILLHNI